MSEAGKVLVKCDYCRKMFFKKRWQMEHTKSHFCSRNCFGKWISETRRGEANSQYKEKITVYCDYCGKEKEIFPCHDETYEKHFCNMECYAKWKADNLKGESNPRYTGKIKVACAYCGKEKEVYPSSKKTYTKHFCNTICRGKYKYSGGRKAAEQRRSQKPEYILGRRISAGMRKSLKQNGINKKGYHWESLVDYSRQDLERRLKKTMPSGYSWQDFLDGKLHIDHIIPQSAFHFESVYDLAFKECWSLKNLRLLPAEDNMRKHNKLLNDFQPVLNLELLEGV